MNNGESILPTGCHKLYALQDLILKDCHLLGRLPTVLPGKGRPRNETSSVALSSVWWPSRYAAGVEPNINAPDVLRRFMD
jgi:hypothetical protein